MKWLEIDQDNLRTGTAKAVARFMSFAQITCRNSNKQRRILMKFYINDAASNCKQTTKFHWIL